MVQGFGVTESGKACQGDVGSAANAIASGSNASEMGAEAARSFREILGDAEDALDAERGLMHTADAVAERREVHIAAR